MPVRTPAEHPLRLHSWRLRFYSANTMFQPAPEAADAYLRDVLSAAASEAASSEVPDLEALLHNQRECCVSPRTLQCFHCWTAGSRACAELLFI